MNNQTTSNNRVVYQQNVHCLSPNRRLLCSESANTAQQQQHMMMILNHQQPMSSSSSSTSSSCPPIVHDYLSRIVPSPSSPSTFITAATGSSRSIPAPAGPLKQFQRVNMWMQDRGGYGDSGIQTMASSAVCSFVGIHWS